MANGDYPDRSKQRSNDGIIGAFTSTASDVLDFKNTLLTKAQTGSIGSINYYTNLFENLGKNLLTGGNSRRAIEESLFGIDFGLDKDTSFGFETKPIGGPQGLKRDYRLNITKKF
jgi:hypothetical protein